MSTRRTSCFAIMLMVLLSTTASDTDSVDDVELTGDMPNVCSSVESRTVTTIVPCLKSYDHLVKTWSHNCSNGRRLCPIYEHKTEYYRSEQSVSKPVNVTVYHCCLGWTRLIHDHGCPIAMQPSRVQRKTPMRRTHSHPLDAISGCPPNRFGMHCEYSCSQCMFGTCNWRLRTCDCQLGFTGIFCNQTRAITSSMRSPTDESYRCQFCHKGNTASCHMETGKCQCLPGYRGTRCEEDCPTNFFGRECLFRCSCQNAGKCDRRDGHCFCPTGFTGTRCESPCQKGSFGHMCMQRCQCGSGGDNICHPRTGECNSVSCNGQAQCLLEQQRRKSLLSLCPEGFYEPPMCRQKCMCMNNAQCDPVSGRCLCHSGHFGRYCERTCERGWYGSGCIHRCECHNGASCDARTGTCQCGIGMTGRLCEQECAEGTFGRNCSETCLCQHGARCNKLTGCCACAIGYFGTICQFECRPFTFGFYCSQTCNCSVDTSNGCDPKTGTCRCKTGFLGDRCETQCPSGQWGNGCSNRCDCNGSLCDHRSGTCYCPPGRTGTRCEQDCPDNTFGYGCKPCSCQSFHLCDKVTGECRCRQGWKGDACQFPLSANGPGRPDRGDMYKKDT